MDLTKYSLPLSNPRHEVEAQEYARNYNCTIEKARLDVAGENGETLTDTDAFYERMEAR